MKKGLCGLTLLLIGISFLSINAFAETTMVVPNEGIFARLYQSRWKDLTIDSNQLNRMIREIFKVREYEPTSIDKFSVKDINGDEVDELLVTVNFGGNIDPSGIIIFYAEGPIIKVQRIFTYRADLDRDIKDLNSDGKYEIIIRSILAASNSCAESIAWHTIYQWNKDKWSEASRKYPLYYKKFYIPNLEEGLAHIRAQDPEKLAKNSKYGPEWWKRWKERAISDRYMGIDKARRLLGEDPRAGFNRAVGWLERDDAPLKRNAIKVFWEIGDDECIKYLEMAAKDKNEFISWMAKRALDKLRKAKR